MPKITIDEVEYDLDTLPDNAKAQLASLQAVERRLAQLQEEHAILQTARNAYGKALKECLEAPVSPAGISWPNPH